MDQNINQLTNENNKMQIIIQKQKEQIKTNENQIIQMNEFIQKEIKTQTINNQTQLIKIKDKIDENKKIQEAYTNKIIKENNNNQKNEKNNTNYDHKIKKLQEEFNTNNNLKSQEILNINNTIENYNYKEYKWNKRK